MGDKKAEGSQDSCATPKLLPSKLCERVAETICCVSSCESECCSEALSLTALSTKQEVRIIAAWMPRIAHNAVKNQFASNERKEALTDEVVLDCVQQFDLVS